MSVTIANTDAQLSGKTLLTADANQTITGLKTYDRGVSAPLAIVSGAAKVTNLDADKLDGEEGTAFHDASLLTGTVAAISGGTGLSSYAIGDLLYASGTTTLAKLADVATGQVLVSGGVATAPAYSASPSLSGTLGVTGLITSTGGITGGASSHTTGAFSSTVTGGTYNSQTISSAANFTGTMAVTGAISSSTSVALTGTTNNLGTITTGVWNAGAVTSSGSVTALSGIFTAPVSANVLDLRGRSADSISTVLFKSNDGASQYAKFQVASNSFQFDVASGAATNFTVNGSATMSISSAGILTVSAMGNYHAFGTGGTASSNFYAAIKLNGSSGTNGGAGILLQANSVDQGYFSTYNLVFGGTTTHPILWSSVSGGLDLFASNASGAIRFYTGGTTLRGTIGTGGSLEWVGALIGGGGVVVGTNATANLVDDASNGGASTTLYIGNASINVTSDRRLKRDILPTVIDAGALLSQLSVVDYVWNDPTDTSWNNRNARGRWTGLIAQDTIGVMPWVVNAPRHQSDLSIDWESPESWHIEFDHIVPVLVRGWQQHDATISQLAARIAALESQDN